MEKRKVVPLPDEGNTGRTDGISEGGNTPPTIPWMILWIYENRFAQNFPLFSVSDKSTTKTSGGLKTLRSDSEKGRKNCFDVRIYFAVNKNVVASDAKKVKMKCGTVVRVSLNFIVKE